MSPTGYPAIEREFERHSHVLASRLGSIALQWAVILAVKAYADA
jgi:hypothetical protein